MGMLHAFALEATRMKAMEILATAQFAQEENRADIDKIRNSANEFISELEKIPFTSENIEILAHRGFTKHPI